MSIFLKKKDRENSDVSIEKGQLYQYCNVYSLKWKVIVFSPIVPPYLDVNQPLISSVVKILA